MVQSLRQLPDVRFVERETAHKVFVVQRPQRSLAFRPPMHWCEKTICHCQFTVVRELEERATSASELTPSARSRPGHNAGSVPIRCVQYGA